MKRDDDRRRYYEDGLSSRTKDYLVAIVEQAVGDILAEENVHTPAAIRSYRQIFDLIQADTYLRYQRDLLSRNADEEHPINDVAAKLVQLERADIALQALVGYFGRIQSQVSAAEDNLKRTANVIFEAHQDDEMGVVTLEDKDDVTWQIYTSAATPDSVVVRRRKATGKFRRIKRPGSMRGWQSQEHRSSSLLPKASAPSSVPSAKPKRKSNHPTKTPPTTSTDPSTPPSQE